MTEQAADSHSADSHTEDSHTEDAEPEAGEMVAEVEFIAAERLTFFTDAAVAIALTLLAFGLLSPHIASNAGDRTARRRWGLATESTWPS
jgi:hypothetical protein